jgi:hypothetical protein
MFVPAFTIWHHVTNETDSQNAGALADEEAAEVTLRLEPRP